MSTLSAPASNGLAETQDSDSLGESTVETLRVYKDVCHRIRSSLIAGTNEIVSPTTISRTLVKESLQKQDVSCPSSDEAPSAVSPGGTMEHTVLEESCPFLEGAEGWSIEYSGGGCQVRCKKYLLPY